MRCFLSEKIGFTRIYLNLPKYRLDMSKSAGGYSTQENKLKIK